MARLIDADASLEQWKDIQGYEGLEMLSTEVKMILPFSKEAIETKVIASGEAIEIIRKGGVE